MPGFDRPALVVWANGDRVMPPEHGRRLAELLPQGRLVEVEDSYTLIPLDRPAGLGQIIREFVITSPWTVRAGRPTRQGDDCGGLSAGCFDDIRASLQSNSDVPSARG
jgi:hypothetical protein